MPTATDHDNPPSPVEELLPKVTTWAAELGELPSRNRIMTEFRVGTAKATTLLKKLKAGGITPTRDRDAEPDTLRRLHVVPDHEPGGNQENPPSPARTDAESLPAHDDHDDHAGTQTDSLPAPSAQPRPAREAESGDREPLQAGHATTHNTPAGPRAVTSPAPRAMRVWPLLLLALPAFVSIWSGWVGLGELAGFGVVHPLPGILPGVQLNTAITLPIGVETYAAYALRVWLADNVPADARRFARASAIGSLILGALGQVAYHLLTAAGLTSAPWWITTMVACLPVAVLGMGAALAHLLRQQPHSQ
jgi:hypothetical protein